jgi:LuxR family maltose regulon positive regulatory protein
LPESVFPILRTKLHRPQLSGDLIERPHLTDLLNQALERQLTLVSAPAGFGKTTLLCQWLETAPFKFAWLQLDEEDNRIHVLLAYLLAALSDIFPHAFEETLTLLNASQLPALSIVVATLINELDALGETPFILVLDDYQFIHNREIDLMFGEILRFPPRGLRLVIASRRDPSISFSKLRMQERLLDIRAANLRFSSAEIDAFLVRNLGVSLSGEALETLKNKTEGWIGGLRMAVLTLQDEPDAEGFVNRLHGSSRLLMEYMLDEVLLHQHEETKEFLLKTSILERMNAPLCQAVAGEGDRMARDRLAQIEGANLFLVPLDDRHEWFRYHHLFRQMLQERLKERYSEEQITALHRQAIEWFSAHGSIEEALQHCIAIGDLRSAALLVEAELCEALNREKRLAISRWLALFPEEFLRSRPGLLMLHAWEMHFNFELAGIRPLIKQIQAVIDDESAPGFEEINRRAMQCQVDILVSQTYFWANMSSASITFARKVLAEMPPEWQFVRGNAFFYLGLSMQAEGQGREAVRLLQQAYQAFPDRLSPGRVRVLFGLCYILHQMGDLDQARESAERLLQDARTVRLYLLQGWAHDLLGRCAYERNQLELAATHFAELVRLRYVVNFGGAEDGLAGLALSRQAMGQSEQARQTLETWQQFLRERPGIQNGKFRSLQARLACTQGDLAPAQRWLEGFDPMGNSQMLIWIENSLVTRARILLALETPQALQEVGSLLDLLLVNTEKTYNLPLNIAVLAMKATWLDAQGHNEEALAVLHQALFLAFPGRFIRTFVDLGPRLAGLLGQLKEDQLSNYISQILEAFSVDLRLQKTPKPASSASMSALLTERELEVLKLLAGIYSVQEIADMLFISISTLRQHQANIYKKLGVSKRRLAVAKGIEIGLISTDGNGGNQALRTL